VIYQLSVPDAVEGVEEIRILEWHQEPAATIDVGDLIVELETHKAVVQIRAAQGGVLRETLAEAGDWRAVGIPIAIFSTTPDENVSDHSANDAAMLVEFEVT
jgi:pyruvate/2-oxoglutarate dehydrogenase complex dihydrolipoamide acyltransferase (E2) component